METKVLTNREYEVAELIARGLSKKEIADFLEISPFTVDELLRRAKTKLHLQKSTEITAWYYISKYHISISISERLRRVVSAALLLISLYAIIGTSTELLRVFNSGRTIARTMAGRTTRGRGKNDIKFSIN